MKEGKTPVVGALFLLVFRARRASLIHPHSHNKEQIMISSNPYAVPPALFILLMLNTLFR